SGTPLLVRVQDHLSVAVRLKDMPEAAQVLADLEVVVDLAVMGQRKATVVAQHWHVAVLAEVEDAEPLVGQRAGSEAALAGVVGPTVALGVGHAGKGRKLLSSWWLTVESKNAGDTTHWQSASVGWELEPTIGIAKVDLSVSHEGKSPAGFAGCAVALGD